MKKQSFPMVMPNVSAAGTYCRTVSFVNSLANDIIVWHEAVENPLSNQWKIQEVSLTPDIYNTGGEYVVSVKDVKGKETLSLVDAIAELATFEYSNKKNGNENS